MNQNVFYLSCHKRKYTRCKVLGWPSSPAMKEYVSVQFDSGVFDDDTAYLTPYGPTKGKSQKTIGLGRKTSLAMKDYPSVQSHSGFSDVAPSDYIPDGPTKAKNQKSNEQGRQADNARQSSRVGGVPAMRGGASRDTISPGPKSDTRPGGRMRWSPCTPSLSRFCRQGAWMNLFAHSRPHA